MIQDAAKTWDFLIDFQILQNKIAYLQHGTCKHILFWENMSLSCWVLSFNKELKIQLIKPETNPGIFKMC